ncbi:MAG: FmdB family zinc ribbon protein [Pseudonocardiaceae bacterium]
MPTYSYACTACEHRFDTKQSFTDPSLTDCPECAGRLRKLFSPVGVVFKGSGFYRTDSRAKPPSESGTKDKSDKSDKAQSDAKPDTKSDTKSGSSSSGASSASSGAGGSSGTSGSSSAKSSSASASTS